MSTVNPGQPAPPAAPVEPQIPAPPQQSGGSWVLGDAIDEVIYPEGEPIPVPQPVPAAPVAPAPVAAPPAAPVAGQHEIRTRTGLVFRGNTPEEAVAMAQAYYDRLGSEIGPSATPAPTYSAPPAPHQPAATPVPEWTNEAFFKTFAANPREAMRMAVHEIIGDPEEFLGRVDHSYSVAVQVQDRIAIADFLASNSDFPASPESAALVIRRLERDNQDVTSWNLEVAYRQLVKEGVMAPIQTAPEGPAQFPADYRAQYGAPAPAPVEPSRGAAAPPAPSPTPVPVAPAAANGAQLGDTELTLAQFEALNANDMRRYMARRSQLGYRFS